MAYPLAVRADSYRGRRNDDFGARVAAEGTLGTNLREDMGRHLVAAEHSDKRPPMSPPAATSHSVFERTFVGLDAKARRDPPPGGWVETVVVSTRRTTKG